MADVKIFQKDMIDEINEMSLAFKKNKKNYLKISDLMLKSCQEKQKLKVNKNYPPDIQKFKKILLGLPTKYYENKKFFEIENEYIRAYNVQCGCLSKNYQQCKQKVIKFYDKDNEVVPLCKNHYKEINKNNTINYPKNGFISESDLYKDIKYDIF